MLVILAASVALVSCAADGASAPATVDAGAAVTMGTNTHTLVGGSSVDLDALTSRRPVALWFWAPG
jgi:hypothetical protein